MALFVCTLRADGQERVCAAELKAVVEAFSSATASLPSTERLEATRVSLQSCAGGASADSLQVLLLIQRNLDDASIALAPTAHEEWRESSSAADTMFECRRPEVGAADSMAVSLRTMDLMSKLCASLSSQVHTAIRNRDQQRRQRDSFFAQALESLSAQLTASRLTALRAELFQLLAWLDLLRERSVSVTQLVTAISSLGIRDIAVSDPAKFRRIRVDSIDATSPLSVTRTVYGLGLSYFTRGGAGPHVEMTRGNVSLQALTLVGTRSRDSTSLLGLLAGYRAHTRVGVELTVAGGASFISARASRRFEPLASAMLSIECLQGGASLTYSRATGLGVSISKQLYLYRLAHRGYRGESKPSVGRIGSRAPTL